MIYPITSLDECERDLERLTKRVAELESTIMPSTKQEMKFMFILFWASTWGLIVIHQIWLGVVCALSTAAFLYTIFCTYRCACAIYHGNHVIEEIKDYISEHYPEA